MKIFECIDENGICTNRWLEQTGDETYRDSTFPNKFTIKTIIIEPDYRQLRATEYAKIDHLKEEAQAEYMFENRTEKAEQYSALRQAIKDKFPKPSES